MVVQVEHRKPSAPPFYPLLVGGALLEKSCAGPDCMLNEVIESDVRWCRDKEIRRNSFKGWPDPLQSRFVRGELSIDYPEAEPLRERLHQVSWTGTHLNDC